MHEGGSWHDLQEKSLRDLSVRDAVLPAVCQMLSLEWLTSRGPARPGRPTNKTIRGRHGVGGERLATGLLSSMCLHLLDLQWRIVPEEEPNRANLVPKLLRLAFQFTNSEF